MNESGKVYLVLKGRACTGKTTTLRILKERLFGDMEAVVNYGNADILIHGEYRGTEIGILTAGDVAEEIEERLNGLSMCDIIICACRTSGKTKDLFDKLGDNNKVFYISRTVIEASNMKYCYPNEWEDKANSYQAKLMSDTIDAIIENKNNANI